MEGITKIRAHNLRKFVEARSEYQTTRYTTSKPLNTSWVNKNTGTSYTLSRPPRYSLTVYNLPNTQLNNHTLSVYTFSITTRYSTVTSFTEKHSQDQQNTCSSSSITNVQCHEIQCQILWCMSFLTIHTRCLSVWDPWGTYMSMHLSRRTTQPSIIDTITARATSLKI